MMVAYENDDCSMEATRHFPLRLHVVHRLANSYTLRFSFPEKTHAHICTLIVAQQPAGLLIHLSAWPLSFSCLCLRVFRTNSSPCPLAERHPRVQGVAWGVGDTGPRLGTRVEWRIRCVLWEFLGCHGLGPAAHCGPGTAPLTFSDHRLIQ